MGEERVVSGIPRLLLLRKRDTIFNAIVRETWGKSLRGSLEPFFPKTATFRNITAAY